MRSFIVGMGLALFVGLPAHANFDVKAKVTCYDSSEGTTKLPSSKGGNETIVADCLGVPVTDPQVALHSLVFDSDFRELHVVRNCDTQIICDLSDQVVCASAFDGDESAYKLNQVCIYDLIEFGVGSMICKESESWNASKDKFSFKTSCNGNLEAGGSPCELSFKSGKLFQESGACPE